MGLRDEGNLHYPRENTKSGFFGEPAVLAWAGKSIEFIGSQIMNVVKPAGCNPWAWLDLPSTPRHFILTFNSHDQAPSCGAPCEAGSRSMVGRGALIFPKSLAGIKSASEQA
jgi:hypothetical protein